MSAERVQQRDVERSLIASGLQERATVIQPPGVGEHRRLRQQLLLALLRRDAVVRQAQQRLAEPTAEHDEPMRPRVGGRHDRLAERRQLDHRRPPRTRQREPVASPPHRRAAPAWSQASEGLPELAQALEVARLLPARQREGDLTIGGIDQLSCGDPVQLEKCSFDGGSARHR